ncbi:MAG: hypothetical protein U1E60_06665 [Reyranellaceae bacterium]
MATSSRGRSVQLTKQIGEHLVAAELGRRQFIAAPFAGNVPLFDLLAASEHGHAVPVQVKTSNGYSWHLNVDQHLEIEMDGQMQVVKGKKSLPNPRLICVYVMLNANIKDDFYILLLSDVQHIAFREYKTRIRPKNPTSKHFAMYPEWLQDFKDNWSLLDRELEAPQSPVTGNR